MAYVSLYRKYRPQSFAEIVGQDHVTRTLQNAVAEGRLHHAYLFTGPRGTGKTSTARILAKAVNCAEGPTPEPCGACEHCTAIADGSSVDVIELDMASHGGVDDARDLRERALFAPASTRRKVYILDEVHMASQAAFNALLKLIEEPPGHVLFAMATTDPQKVIPTIMSRVQRLDLRRVASGDLTGYVERIAGLEGVALEAAAVQALVRAGDGSVRDTLSILEQVIAFAGRSEDATARDGGATGEIDVTADDVSEPGEDAPEAAVVTAGDVAQVLGITPAERTFEAAALIAAQDLAGVLALVQDLLDAGHDLRRFALDLAGHLRDLLVRQVAPDRPDLIEGTAEWRQRLAGQAGLIPRDRLLAAVDVLADAIAEMRRGPARLPLELALATIAASGSGVGSDSRTAAADTHDDVADAPAAAAADPDGPASSTPADDTGSGPTRGGDVADSGTDAETETETDDTETYDTETDVATETASAPDRDHDGDTDGHLDLEQVVAAWAQVLDVLRAESIRLHAIVQAGTPTRLDDDTLTIAFPKPFHAEETAKQSHAALLRDAVEQALGVRLAIRTEIDEPAPTDGDGQAATSPPVSPEEEQVREAERTDDEDEQISADRAERLLRDELDAERVEGE